jgi:hypothetical protein
VRVTATKKTRKRPGKMRRKLYKVVSAGLMKALKDRAARKQAQGAKMGGGGQRSSSGAGGHRTPVRASSGWSRPNNCSPGAAIPAMPADYTATGWDGKPVTEPAGLRFFWARENGYSGPIDQDGYPTDDPDEDRSGELEWADGDDDDQADQDVDQGDGAGSGEPDER